MKGTIKITCIIALLLFQQLSTAQSNDNPIPLIVNKQKWTVVKKEDAAISNPYEKYYLFNKPNRDSNLIVITDNGNESKYWKDASEGSYIQISIQEEGATDAKMYQFIKKRSNLDSCRIIFREPGDDDVYLEEMQLTLFKHETIHH